MTSPGYNNTENVDENAAILTQLEPQPWLCDVDVKYVESSHFWTGGDPMKKLQAPISRARE